MRASSTRSPSEYATTGLRSISRTSACAAANSEIFAMSPAIASRSAGAFPRAPCKSATPRNSPSIARAPAMVIGAILSAVSLKISTNVPPSPTITSAPKRSSRVIPTISSIPGAAIACTATPSKRAPGRLAARLCRMRSKAALTSAGEPRPSSTPPTSLLCTACGDSTLSAAGKPTRAASSAASSALCARWAVATGIPIASRICLDSISDSSLRPAPRASASMRASIRSSVDASTRGL